MTDEKQILLSLQNIRYLILQYNMPIHLKENIKNIISIYVWKLTETEEELLLLRPLSTEEYDCFCSLKNGKRRKEWLTNRILLEQAIGKNFSLEYLPDGKPLLRNPDLFLSISHSANFVALCLSKNKNVGIDIEKIRENIASLKHKFLLKKEAQIIDNSDVKLLHIYWGAKEAMYKMYSLYRPLFTEHLLLSCIDIQNGCAIGKIGKEDFNKTVNVIFKQIEDNMLVCCFED